MAFLTLEDPNAKIKGSRDPLGVQPMWSSVGRRLVTNLTTVTDSVRGFTVLVLGRYFAARLIDDGRIGQEDALGAALRMEQIGAYVRHVAHGVEGSIRGIERVKRNLDEGGGKVSIGTDRKGMILSDQKVYGLWGLYTVAARTSDLIPEGPAGVTEQARELVEGSYLPRLAAALGPLLHLLHKGGTLTTKRGDPVFDAMANVLTEELTPEELDFYGRHLRDALVPNGSPDGRQQRFRRLLEEGTDLDASLTREEVAHLIDAARKQDEALAHSLRRVLSLESLLAPADAAFDFLLNQQGQRPGDAADQLREKWGPRVPNLDPEGFDEMLPDLREVSNTEIVAAARRCHATLAGGAYEDALMALSDWNARVMAGRKAAPWVRVAENGRIDVRYRGAERVLPPEEELPDLWRNDYFVGSLKRVTRQLQEPA